MEEIGIPSVHHEIGLTQETRLTKQQFQLAVKLLGEKRAIELVEQYGIED